MNNIYVDELPKRCNECKFQVFIAYHKNGWEHKERFCSVMKNNYDCICSKENCPLKSLKDTLAEERKKVVSEIRQKLCRIEDTLINLGNGKEDALSYFVDILDQIEGASDE